MRKSKSTYLKLVFVILLATNYASTLSAQTLKDIDGNQYKTIKYGRQEWMAENLNVSRFQNGDPIPEAKTAADWEKAGKSGKPAWCYYNDDPENGKKLGKLYNWYAINDKRGLAPQGWKIPGNAEWSLLIKNLQGVDVAGYKLKSKLIWKKNSEGTNNIGFSAIPGGYCIENGTCKDIGSKGQWWSNSSPVRENDMVYSILLNDFTPEVGYFKVNKQMGLSVRCLREIK